MKILDLGCGIKKYKSENPEDVVISIDIVKTKGVDALYDLRKGISFQDNSFEKIIAHNILEHMTHGEFEFLMEEMNRVCKPDGIVDIEVPFFASDKAFATIDHKLFFAYNTFWRYGPEDWGHYTKKVGFKIIEQKIIWKTHPRLKLLNWVVSKIINSAPMLYQTFFCWIAPADLLQVKLRVVK